MNQQIISLLAGATVALIPFMAQSTAQAAPLNGPGIHMAGPGNGQGEMRDRMVQELKLTPEQQQQLKALRESRRSQMEGILTEAQRNQVKTALQGKKGMREAMKSANLSDTQKQQIRALMQEGRKDLESILNEEQKAILRSKMQERQGKRGHRAKQANSSVQGVRHTYL
jgi:periplasmic protein CpxP/Spy